MVWTLFYFLLASAYLAEAQTGESCGDMESDMEGALMINPDDCQAYWLCLRTGLDSFAWKAGRCPDGYIAEEDEGCIEGTCDEVTEPPPPPPPIGPADTFDCAAAGAATGYRGYADPLDCSYYWWCWVIDGKWFPKVYKCPEYQRFKQYAEICWEGPCIR